MVESSSSPAFSWKCPACGRRVPARVATCRCGHVLDADEAAALSALSGEASAEDGGGEKKSASATGLAIVLAFAAIAAALYWVQSRRPAPENPSEVAVPVLGDPDDDRKLSEPAASAPGSAAPEAVSEPARAPEAPLPVPTHAPAPAAAPTTPPPTPGASLEDLVVSSMPAVVRVETPLGSGSGFFVQPDTILTNVHVVGTNLLVTIRRPDGRTQQARVDKTASELDIAVLRVSGADANQPTLRMGSAAQARAGQEVMALGSPLGLQNTVTRGIVSAVRQVGALTLVQTDAAINPGNSGGPLLARSGEVIGITTMGIRPDAAQGLSFAVAIEHARALLAGQRTQATGTPLTALTQAMNAQSSSSEPDSRRAQGAQAYQQAMTNIARRADQLDGHWNTFKRSCYEGRVVGAFDREWFALWEPRAMQGAVAPGCNAIFTDVRRIADEIRTAVVAAEEAARQADVYPGTRRDVLRSTRLDYAGWAR